MTSRRSSHHSTHSSHSAFSSTFAHEIEVGEGGIALGVSSDSKYFDSPDSNLDSNEGSVRGSADWCDDFDLGSTSASVGVDQGEDSNVRWFILVLASVVMFGNFYAYDLPAALNKPLQAYLGADDETYQYQLNLLYSLYSLPNIILPFFGGYLVDRFGTRRLMTFLSFLVCLGQLLFTFGVVYRHYVLMQFGRIVFGFGGESLQVAQTRITTKWFKGKELAFALGINLSVSRLGTVLTDFLSPHLALEVSLPPQYGKHYRPHSPILSASHHPKYEKRNSRISNGLASQEALLGRGLSPSYKDHSEHVHVPTFNELLDFSIPFWQIVLVMCLMFATVIPFNTIHAAFLQLKWYPGTPKKVFTTAQIMAIPDLLSAFLVPFVGTFVDKFGRRSMVLFVCGVTMATPIPMLIVLAGSYALLLTFWPCIPLVVPERRVATAFGLATSAQNAALTVFPMIVAALVNFDPTYRLTEFFFFTVSCLGSRRYNGSVLDLPLNARRVE
ncbi:MFS general substrate transporter [Rhizoclosmatium globosum]|uniref:Lysosomal dipeptide transporter MFSD1 n=1 Tax=Rhizoclosmatium globosum TaxID=329046 RepID=A0A1Y2B6Q6_9FUNG|nr:MFS general substrate transporter [Rhizoclosmatium globosum]|eukprot:ORY30523.1 MFS general substrate transporter [Rhizoclosmatium globosum]